MKPYKQPEGVGSPNAADFSAREEDGDFVSTKQRIRRELGERITDFRVRRGLRRVQLARRLGISPSRLGKWEGGVHAPSAEHLLGLAAALGVSLEELMTGRRPAPPLRLSPEHRESLRPAVLFLMALVGIGPSGREPEEIREP